MIPNSIDHIFSLLNSTPNWKYQLGLGQNYLQQRGFDDQLRMFEEQLNAMHPNDFSRLKTYFTPASQMYQMR